MNDPSSVPDDDLVAFLDGHLDADSAAAEAVRRRLDADPAFARRAAELRALDALLGEYPATPSASGAADAVLAAVRRDDARRSFFARLRGGAAASAVVLAVGLAWPRAEQPTVGPGEKPRAEASTTSAAPEALVAFADLARDESAGDAEELAELEESLARIARVEADYFAE
jgi:anti-sigma factor RsiW